MPVLEIVLAFSFLWKSMLQQFSVDRILILIQHVYPRYSKLKAKKKSVAPESTATVVLFALHLHFGETYKGLCKVRMRTADADGGRRTAES